MNSGVEETEEQLKFRSLIAYTRDEKGNIHIAWHSLEPILDETTLNKFIGRPRGESRQMSEENRVSESEERPEWSINNFHRVNVRYASDNDTPNYNNITPEHPYTQRTIEQATKHLQPELLDSFRNMAIATAFYLVQLRLAGLSEHMAEMAIKEWHRSEMKVGPGRSEYEGALDNE